MSREELRLKLAHWAFTIIERKHEDLFLSDLEILTPNISAIDLLPANLIRLGELNFNNLDAPTTLMRASTSKIENLVSVGQNRPSKLCFMTIPETIDCPADRAALEQPIEEVLSEPIFKWLSTGLRGSTCHPGTALSTWNPEDQRRAPHALPARFQPDCPIGRPPDAFPCADNRRGQW